MLNDRRAEFAQIVWAIVRRTGRSAPLIANELIGQMFPKTLAAAEKEGGDRMFRAGVIAEIKRVIREKDHWANECGADDDDRRQGDFEEIDPSFRPLVEALGKGSYYVEQIGAHMTVGELIDDPDLLDDARRFMRRKGDECHAEAYRLDQLYEAVVAKRDGS